MLRFEVDFLLDLDLLTFDRMLDKANEARRASLIELAQVVAFGTAYGFSGEKAGFDEFCNALLPEHLRTAGETEKVKKSMKQLESLFGG